MFKLIALRPLKGCRESALKCLKIGQMYYFCNDYIITEDGIRMRDEYVKPLPEDFFTTTESKGLRVNIPQPFLYISCPHFAQVSRLRSSAARRRADSRSCCLASCLRGRCRPL